MKLSILAFILAPILAHAGTPTLECNVISTGSGKGWTNVFHYSAPVNAKRVQLPKTAVTAFGNTLSIAADVTNQLNDPQFPSVTLGMTVSINNDQISMYKSDIGAGELRPTRDLLNTQISFTLNANTSTPVNYDVTCAMKPTP